MDDRNSSLTGGNGGPKVPVSAGADLKFNIDNGLQQQQSDSLPGVLKLEPVDAAGKVTVTLDKMRVFINISMPKNDGKPLSGEAIRALIAENNVVYGLRELTIQRLIQSPLYDRDVMIAEGTAPQKGKDGTLIYHVRLSKEAVPHENEDGSVDYKNLGLVENVEKNQVLCTKIPAEAGVDGRNVLGEPVPAQPGKDFALPVGKNTVITEDGLELRAAISGQCDFYDRKLNVAETFTVKGDVSTSTGNISFVGNVVVNGSVFAGFRVQAGGNIDINGCVEGSYLNAGGNIFIRDGFHGMFKGEVIAGGGIRSKYIQAGRVQAGGVIETQVILQSNVQSSDSIKLVGSRSTIMGGRVIAKSLIECKIIGGKNNAVPTIVEVGSDPQLVVRQQEIQREQAEAIKTITDVDRLLVLFRQLDEQNRLTGEKRDMMFRSVATRRTISEKLLSLKEEEEEIRLKLAEEGYGTIIARSAVYPGVRIVIGTEQMIVSSAYSGTMFVRTENGLLDNPVK